MTVSTYNNILAIDTSTMTLKLALSFGKDRLIKSSNPAERSHGQVIIKKIDELLGSAGLQKNDLDALVVSRGPGSFTGLRIGLAAVKGIAVALRIPVVGIDLFELAAYKLRNEPRPVSLLIPFKRDRFFVTEVDKGMYDVDAISVVTVTDLPGIIGSRRVSLIGVDPGAVSTWLDTELRVEVLEYDASDMLELGLVRLSGGAVDDLALLEPMYVQKSQAEIRFDQRQKK